MDVLSLGPLPVGSLLWQPRPSAWVLTVVCKATYLLRPGEAELAPEQEPIRDEDEHRDDDPEHRVCAPSDLAPVKPRTEVLLVGRAHVPKASPRGPLRARLQAGDVDKWVEVHPDRAAPLGFEPLGERCPARVERLGRWAGAWSPADLADGPLPEGLDLGYFNRAPADQQPQTLRDDERLVLEHLHPEHPCLVTRLPGVRPAAFVDRRRGPAQRLPMRADTLWIDTDRAIATLTWRGQLPLERRDEAGRVVIALETPPRELTWFDVEHELGLGRRRSSRARAVATPPPSDDPITSTQDVTELLRGPALPFLQASPPPPPPSSSSPPPPPRLPPAVLLPSAAPPVDSPWAAGASIATAAPRPTVGMAAAAMASSQHAPTPPPAPEPAPPPARDRDVHRLIWVDPESLPRIRRVPRWRRVLDALQAKPIDPELDDPALAKAPLDVEDRRDAFEILAHGEPADARGVEEAFERAIRDGGKLVPPLLLLCGELTLPFDELETLKAALTAVTSMIAPPDEGLKAAASIAKDLLQAPGLSVAPAVCEAVTARLREAFAREKKGLPPGWLEAQIERALLVGRHYQTREVLGDVYLRAHLRASSDDIALVAYVPAALSRALPMYRRFQVRLIAELHLREDEGETSPYALRVLALARSAPRPRPAPRALPP